MLLGLVGLGAGVLSGMFGVGGGFIIVPALVVLRPSACSGDAMQAAQLHLCRATVSQLKCLIRIVVNCPGLAGARSYARQQSSCKQEQKSRERRIETWTNVLN